MIDLWNIDFADVSCVYSYADEGYNFVCVQPDDDSIIDVMLDAGTDRTITFALADSSTLRYDSADNIWQRNNATITEVNGTPVNVRLSNGTAYIYPTYDGDFALDDLNDSSINTVSAYYDTLNGRKISGDERVNEVARIISGAEITPESIATAKTLIK